MVRAGSAVAMAHKIEELPIYSKVVEFWAAVNALLDKPKSSDAWASFVLG